ncbi:hypothetical protein [Blastopirellula retiformator]|uniref:Outer membrane efflux protein n=1 Tax=Blastopirellula retiformator TaxID=2527970 RepID=A0A5C5UZC6_9BACT|nr:hypothetical protein [Blastopirellula retiformator]TWT30842.1 hypothetical protein Enr8_43680 [Blastopirellula retiformator]
MFQSFSVTCRRLFAVAAACMLMMTAAATASAGYELELNKIRKTAGDSGDVSMAADLLNEELEELFAQVDDDLDAAVEQAVIERLTKLQSEIAQARTSKYRTAYLAVRILELTSKLHAFADRPMEATPEGRAAAAEHYGKILEEFQAQVAKRNLDKRADSFLKTQIPRLFTETRENPLAPGYGVLLTDSETDELNRLLQATLPEEKEDEAEEPMEALSKEEKAKKQMEEFRTLATAYHKVYFFIVNLERSRGNGVIQVDLQVSLLGKTQRILSEKLRDASKLESEARREHSRQEAERRQRENMTAELEVRKKLLQKQAN